MPVAGQMTLTAEDAFTPLPQALDEGVGLIPRLDSGHQRWIRPRLFGWRSLDRYFRGQPHPGIP